MTAEVILSELGDISRFRNAKAVCAYAGLVPIVRQSGEKKSKHMRITKEGSGLLRWALVEAAWRLVRESPKWAARFSRLMQRSGKKRAIVAMARKLLCVLYAMLRTSTPYQIVSTETKAPRAPGKKVVRISRKEQTATLQTATAEQTATLRPRLRADRSNSESSQAVDHSDDSEADHDQADDGCSDNSQEVAHQANPGADHNHVADRAVPESGGQNKTEVNEIL